MTADDGLLLLQDAVYALTHQDYHLKLTSINNLYVLTDDVTARGLSCDISLANATLIDFEQFVGLSLQFNQLMSW
jgi:sulfur relay protein TusB/DsrH